MLLSSFCTFTDTTACCICYGKGLVSVIKRPPQYSGLDKMLVYYTHVIVWPVQVGEAVILCEDIQKSMFLLSIAPPGPRASMVLNGMVEAESHVMSSWEEEKPNTKKTVS